MRNHSVVLLLFLILVPWAPSLSQTCCTGGVPITGSYKINISSPQSLSLRLTYDYNRIADIFSGKEQLDNGYLSRLTRTVLAQADYAMSSQLSISLLAPYVWLKERVDQRNQTLESQTNGLGDVSVVTQFRQTLSDHSSLVLGIGLKLPTGSTQKINQQDGFAYPPSLQPGSGSYDLLVVTHFQSTFSFRRTLLFSQSVYYRHNTTSSRFTFHENYKFGNEVQSFTGFSDQLLIGSGLHNPSMLLRFRHTRKDQIEDFMNDNTGGSWLYLVPGWNYSITSNVSVGLSGEIPLYRNLNGLQLTTTYRLVLTVGFEFTKNEEILDNKL